MFHWNFQMTTYFFGFAFIRRFIQLLSKSVQILMPSIFFFSYGHRIRFKRFKMCLNSNGIIDFEIQRFNQGNKRIYGVLTFIAEPRQSVAEDKRFDGWCWILWCSRNSNGWTFFCKNFDFIALKCWRVRACSIV